MLPLYGSFPHQLHSSAQQPQLGMNNNPQIPIPFNGGNNNFITNGMNMPNQPGFINGPPHNHNPGLPQMGPIPQHAQTHMGFGPVRGPPPQFGQFNPNMNQFGQFCLPNPMQNMNQFGRMQMPNLAPFVPQNPSGFLANQQFGNLHYNQSIPVVSQQMQGNPAMVVPTSSVQTDQTGKVFPRNHIRPENFNASSRGNWKNSHPGKTFNKNPNRGTPNGRFQNSRSNHAKNGRKNFGSPNSFNGRGLSNDVQANFDGFNSMNKAKEQNKKRSLSLTYTEHEIRQWREERKKNYPSKGNIEKKLIEKIQNNESLRREAETRRERFKEILAKQAELGVEVAEIPESYLLDPKIQNRETVENERPFNKKGRFQNKKGRFDKQARHCKRQKTNEDFSTKATPLIAKKEPTLLEKLLSSDIKRDKSHLLQAFRFMVMNSFFVGSANGALKFPSIIVKDGSGENNVSDKTFVEKVDCDNEDDGDDYENKGQSNCDKRVDKEEEEEEGEIHLT